jgi:hypothetical protein
MLNRTRAPRPDGHDDVVVRLAEHITARRARQQVDGVVVIATKDTADDGCAVQGDGVGTAVAGNVSRRARQQINRIAVGVAAKDCGSSCPRSSGDEEG